LTDGHAAHFFDKAPTLFAAADDRLIQRLVATYHASMIRFARSIVGANMAEDVIQEAWIKAIRALPSFEGRSSLRTWLFSIVHNEAVEVVGRLRRENREPATENTDALSKRFGPNGSWSVPPRPWAAETPEALLAIKDLRTVIGKALEAMPEAQRTLLALRDIDGLSLQEICNVLKISASNARVLLHRGRRRLWTAIEIYQTG
jgi:RNA polymerase sigma-70 factor, ECF subfamily